MIYLTAILNKILYISTILAIMLSIICMGHIIENNLKINKEMLLSKLFIALYVFIFISILVPYNLQNIHDLELKRIELKIEIQKLKLERESLLNNSN